MQRARLKQAQGARLKLAASGVPHLDRSSGFALFRSLAASSIRPPRVLLLCTCPTSLCRRSSAVRDRLNLSVLLLECPLHFKVGLTLSFHPLLLVVSYDTGVHGLTQG
jgi:hypothetical protein